MKTLLDRLWWWQDTHGWVVEEWYTDFITKEKSPMQRRPAKWNLYGRWLVWRYQHSSPPCEKCRDEFGEDQ